jgi:hypothetical protein
MPSLTVMVQEAAASASAQRAVRTGRRDLDQALTAGADRLQQRVVAEPRDLDADLLGGADHQRALGTLTRRRRCVR